MVAHFSHIDPSTASTLFIILASLVGGGFTLINRHEDASVSLQLWLSIAFGSLALLTTDILRALCAAVGLLSALAFRRWRNGQSDDLVNSSLPSGRLFPIVAVISVSWVLLYRLGDEFLSPLVWEATVILNHLQEIDTLEGPQALRSRLLWSQGLLSEGDRSLLYGLPTLYLLTVHSSLESLRIFSVLYFLGAALCMYSLCKRFLNSTIATVTLFTFGLSELGLIFGRYGSSIAATLFALTLALWACGSLVTRPTVRGALVALLCLYVATLGYAPGRIIVLILIGMTVLGIASQSTTRVSSRVCVALVLGAGVIIVGATQHHFGRLHSYAFARGEQITTMFKTGYWPEPLLEQGHSFRDENRIATAQDYISFGKVLLSSTTLPQLSELISPFDQANPITRRFSFDPLSLELYAKPLYPLLLIGLVMASRYTSRWTHVTLLVWATLGCAPVLLTNRVDSYRVSALLIPLSIWIAVGIAEALSEARRAKIPRPLTAGLLLGVVASVTAYRGGSLHHSSGPHSSTARILNKLQPRFLANATIGVEAAEFGTVALAKILIFRRNQLGMAVPSSILTAAQYKALSGREGPEARSRAIDHLVQELNNNKPLIIGPYAAMLPVLQDLAHRGFTVQSLRVEGRSFAFVVKQYIG
jgi:hypothetical protein